MVDKAPAKVCYERFKVHRYPSKVCHSGRKVYRYPLKVCHSGRKVYRYPAKVGDQRFNDRPWLGKSHQFVGNGSLTPCRNAPGTGGPRSTGANWGHSCPLNVGNTLRRSVI